MIEPDRIENFPETRLCQEHGEMIKQYGGEFRFVKERQASLGKPGSIKKNYGDVGGRLIRNHAALEKLLKEYDRLQWEAKKQSSE
jgi:hypothetical protein